jgi:hypothetical protein
MFRRNFSQSDLRKNHLLNHSQRETSQTFSEERVIEASPRQKLSESLPKKQLLESLTLRKLKERFDKKLFARLSPKRLSLESFPKRHCHKFSLTRKSANHLFSEDSLNRSHRSNT